MNNRSTDQTMELLNSLVSGAIAGLIVVIGLYLTLRSNILDDKMTITFENILEDIQNEEKIQKNLYVIGALIGNGLKSGIGIQKKGGKMSLTDIIVQAIAGKFLGTDTESPIKKEPPRL